MLVFRSFRYCCRLGHWRHPAGIGYPPESDKIFADPTTVTGSIGVFGLLFNVEKIEKDYGIFFDGVKSSPLGDIRTISRPKTPTEMAIFQHPTNCIYNAFLYKVAEKRRRG